ncbi:MAG: hypothetical protein U1E42_05970 [Rhodospirillales bacterium]
MQGDSGRNRFPCEVVGVIAKEAEFRAAVEVLLAHGFTRTDLSVLASHDSLDAAGKPATTWRDASVALVGDLRYEVPIVASGAVLLAGGPIAATIAAVIGAAVGGIAVKDVLEEVTAKPHTEAFARSVDAGSLILWVSVSDADRLATAERLLKEHGANNVHIAHPSSAEFTSS